MEFSDLVRASVARMMMPVQRATFEKPTNDEVLDAFRQIGSSRIADFKIDENNIFLYENLAKWIRGDATMKAHNTFGEVIDGDINKGIYIFGHTGVGKSVALDVARSFLSFFRVPLKLEDVEVSLSWKSVLATQICSKFSQEGDISDFTMEKMLCINDLGAEVEEMKGEIKAETLYMGNRRNVMRNLLEVRGDGRANITLFTSNYKINGTLIKAAYGDRVESRLRAMCNYYVLGGKDRRK